MEALKKIKLQYSSFRTNLEKDANGPPNLKPSEDCFLIEESYIKEFEKNNIFPNLSNSYQDVNVLKKIPTIINDFDDAINHINYNIKLKLVGVKLFELMGFKNNLTNTNIVNYYGGNKKLIIEFKINRENKALFLNNYSKDIQSKSNIYIINKSKDLYNNILSNKININNNKEIIGFYKYIGKDSINNRQEEKVFSKKINYNDMNYLNYKTFNPEKSNIYTTDIITDPKLKIIKEDDNEENYKKDLLKIFIYIFYYEKLCSEKKVNIFNKKELYYIINPNWLNDYKKYYNYQTLENLLKKENIDFNFLNMDKSNKSIADIVNICIKNKNILNFNKKDLSQELIKNISQYKFISTHGITYLVKGLIIPSKIMNIIKKIHNISINPNKLYFKNDNIIFIKFKNIIVGNYNDIPYIIAKFVFNYKDNNELNSELKEILSLKINEYINLRQCNENNKDLQILKNEKNEEIGKFFIVNIFKKINLSNNSKLLKGSRVIRFSNSFGKTIIKSPILRGKIGNLNNSPQNKKNNQISKNPQNSSYQKLNNNIHYLTTSNDEYNITSDKTLNNKNIKENFVNIQQINDKIVKDLENKNIEIENLKEELLKVKNQNKNLIKLNFNYKKKEEEYKKKEEEYKKINELKNEIIKKENEFNKKMNYLEEKEKLLEKENIDIENKKKEFEKDIEIKKKDFQKDIENNRRIKQENIELTKKKNDLENQIKEKEKQLNNLNNLNNKILQKQKEQNQNNQNMNYNNNFKNDMDLSQSIGPNTLIRNIERNRKKNNQMNNNQISNNHMNKNQIYYNQKNNNLMNNNQINQNLIMNNIGMNNNNFVNNNNIGMNNKINFGMNNNNFGMYNNNISMNNNNNNNNFGMYNNNISMNNNNIGMYNNNISMNNNNIGMNNTNIGMNNINNFEMNNNNNLVMNNNKNIQLNQNKEQLNAINNNKVKNLKKNVKPSPIKEFTKPTLIGLNNIGSTCFKNAVLQCLSQTENLTNYFLRESSKEAIMNNNIAKKNKNDLQLCPAYYELIHNLWSKSGIKSFSPQSFMDLIDQLSKNDILKFRSGEAGDAKDFIIFILEQFHKELQKPLKTNNNSIKNIPLNQYDKDNVFKHFLNEFQESVSIISDTFFGINETNTICLNCKNNYNSKGLNNPICYNYGIFNLLIFPLEEVRKMKNQQMKFNNININQNNIVDLYECFAYNEKNEYFTGQNQNYCNICKQLSDAIYETKIFSSPNVLIIILNRGKGNEFNVKLNFNELIDITQFVLMKDMPKITYNLYGVITHIGESGPSAHFIASCKSPVDNKWYRYNDAFVSSILNFQKEVIDYGIPYILFYKKSVKNNQNNNNKGKN